MFTRSHVDPLFLRIVALLTGTFFGAIALAMGVGAVMYIRTRLQLRRYYPGCTEKDVIEELNRTAVEQAT